jgi:hypothetical protein
LPTTTGVEFVFGYFDSFRKFVNATLLYALVSNANSMAATIIVTSNYTGFSTIQTTVQPNQVAKV